MFIFRCFGNEARVQLMRVAEEGVHENTVVNRSDKDMVCDQLSAASAWLSDDYHGECWSSFVPMQYLDLASHVPNTRFKHD